MYDKHLKLFIFYIFVIEVRTGVTGVLLIKCL